MLGLGVRIAFSTLGIKTHDLGLIVKVLGLSTGQVGAQGPCTFQATFRKIRKEKWLSRYPQNAAVDSSTGGTHMAHSLNSLNGRI